MRIRQEGTIEEYQDRFKDVRIRLERVMPNLGEAYFLSVFMDGLKDDIRLVVRMMKPSTLSHAFEIAKFKEQFLNSNKKNFAYTKPYQNNFRSATYTSSTPSYKSAQSHFTNSYTPKPINSY